MYALIAAQELNLGVEIQVLKEQKLYQLKLRDGTLIDFDSEANSWSVSGSKESSEDIEAMLEFIRDASDPARSAASDSSEPEGRGNETSDNRPDGQSKQTRK